MNWFEKILYCLQVEMNTPKPYGWYHWLWIILVVVSLICLYKLKNRYNEKQLKLVLGLYGIIALILEIAKQLIWSFNYYPLTNTILWDYEWYAAPFQFCTTPIYVSIICLFLKKGKIRDSMLSYLAYFTILGSLMTIILPDSCFTKDILVNIHTMYLHCGSFVVSIYLLFSKEVEVKFSNIIKGFLIFLIFVLIASLMNITLYNLKIIGDETFNMFYISPYFISVLPVYSNVQEILPYPFFLAFYIITIFLGSNIIYLIAYGISKIKYTNKTSSQKV